jgi:hypothetical protein
VTIYTFILRETTKGKNDHGHHNTRRKNAEDYATAKGCTVLDTPQEMYINGVWHYWWFLDIPDQKTLTDIETQFTVTNTFVEFALNPVQPNP